MKNCKTCRWAACRNYGKEMGSCSNYIMSLEEENRKRDNGFKIVKECIEKYNNPNYLFNS